MPEQDSGKRELDAEEERQITAALSALVAVMKAVGKKRGIAGEMACPCCEAGTLRYTVSAYNGHIWGECSTPGCARWMQ